MTTSSLGATVTAAPLAGLTVASPDRRAMKEVRSPVTSTR
jgi:hypothetical protein